ncbi:hypothetical protein DPMN_188036 [Dreissena polymorpha]|uniref:C-type lectin domain-containing protein n=1 Tax=Dreissena polymorpha TaxID=45954 RepID=A0A9D4I9K5_DREPO|nr:hypothetical protein DPMN_188036 [Dreissena polymorpha]
MAKNTKHKNSELYVPNLAKLGSLNARLGYQVHPCRPSNAFLWYRNDCNNKGGSLVIIKDQQTQQFIMASLGYLGNSKQGIWIGLSDSRKELQWEWVNGVFIFNFLIY